MRYLLDTSVFLWFIGEKRRIPARVRHHLTEPDAELFLSVVSLWEILVKFDLGKLPLPDAANRYIPARREQHGIQELLLTGTAVLRLAGIPPIHRDPFDRMLVCQAIDDGLTLVTGDPRIRAYPAKTLWA
ncbi:MAG TPA: type II toxin-antitoxin system VapC family toxin [Candidatus Xenobia bacterium]